MTALVLYIILGLLLRTLDVLAYALIAYIILGWFVFFGAIKNTEGVIFKIYAFLTGKIEPLLSIIRKFLPSFGGLDLSPLVVFLILHFAKVIIRLIFVTLISLNG